MGSRAWGSAVELPGLKRRAPRCACGRVLKGWAARTDPIRSRRTGRPGRFQLGPERERALLRCGGMGRGLGLSSASDRRRPSPEARQRVPSHHGATLAHVGERSRANLRPGGPWSTHRYGHGWRSGATDAAHSRGHSPAPHRRGHRFRRLPSQRREPGRGDIPDPCAADGGKRRAGQPASHGVGNRPNLSRGIARSRRGMPGPRFLSQERP